MSIPNRQKHSDLRLQLLPAAIILLFGFCGGYDYARHHFLDDREMVTDTLIVVRWDTVTIEKPTEVVRYVVRYDTLKTSEIANVTDSAMLKKIDSLNLTIPIEQAVYSDSTENAQYTAYISGFRATLDSINFKCKNIETIITRTEIEKARRIGFGIQVGVGVTRQGLSPYVGVGVQYRLR